MRKTKEEAELTRFNIIKACYEIITDKGYDRMTRDDIAKKLGMTRGAVNWHFKTKEDIYLATLHFVMNELKKGREQWTPHQELSVMERMRGLFGQPVQQLGYYHFINEIPHYLLKDDRFQVIEQMKIKNIQRFTQDMENWLDELEQETKQPLSCPKAEIAQILYLLFKGLHSRNSKDEYAGELFLKSLPGFLKIVIH
ncbi:MAG: TetR/AcrR family transcriptional regulator [Lachnospiraceae bacterium]|nr:TetR/AcrR family transcriptional regulator [Lachnospiraceae bacterium]